MSNDHCVRGLTTMLRECFEGSPNPWTWFTDSGENSGFLTTLDRIDASLASQQVLPKTQTIAGHVNHVKESLAGANRWHRSGEFNVDWEGTWKVRQVDDAAWTELRNSLKREYEELIGWYSKAEGFEEEPEEWSFALVAHMAFHLGSVRQLASSAVR